MAHIFFPARFRKRMARRKYLSVSRELTTAKLKGFAFSGYLAEVTDGSSIAKRFPESARLGATTVGDTPATFVAPLEDTYETLAYNLESNVEGGTDLAENRNARIVDEMLEYLQLISRVAGVDATLHVKYKDEIQPVFDDRHVHVVLGTTPPGHSKIRVLTHLFDTPLVSGSGDVGVPGPALGRGRIVWNDQKEPVAQIIGSTIYLLVPTTEHALFVLTNRGGGLFRAALMLAWNTYVTTGGSERAPSEELVESADAYVSTVASTHEQMLAWLNESIEHRQSKIAELTKIITEQMSDLRELHEIRRAIVHVRDPRDSAAEWQKLLENPYIDRITRSDDGFLHFHTTPIVMEDTDGTRRNVGVFTVRYVPGRGFYVWATWFGHPRKVPHPHINTDGAICYGNLTIEIQRAVAERRVDAIDLFMRWLAEGYDETLAMRKLSEWPTAAEDTA